MAVGSSLPPIQFNFFAPRFKIERTSHNEKNQRGMVPSLASITTIEERPPPNGYIGPGETDIYFATDASPRLSTHTLYLSRNCSCRCPRLLLFDLSGSSACACPSLPRKELLCCVIGACSEAVGSLKLFHLYLSSTSSLSDGRGSHKRMSLCSRHWMRNLFRFLSSDDCLVPDAGASVSHALGRPPADWE